jgi:hypothetical protein
MHLIARILQLLGLILAGFGLFIGLYVEDLTLELGLGVLGAVLFLAGWMVQKRTSS